MSRITKSYDERRDEIIKMAQSLFLKNGYENTSISDIVDSIGVAKGLCYHYFKSKEQLFDIAMKDYADKFTNEIILIINNKDYSIEDKIFHILIIISEINSNFKNMDNSTQYIKLHNSLMLEVTSALIEPVSNMIYENLDKNVSMVEDTSEVSKFLLFGMMGTIESMFKMKDLGDIKLRFINVIKLVKCIFDFDLNSILVRFKEASFNGK